MGTHIETVVIGLAVDRTQPTAAYEMGYVLGHCIGSLAIFWIGIKTLSLGMKGLSQTGLLLSRNRSINSVVSKLIGAVCILIGSLFLLATLSGIVRLAFTSSLLAVVFVVAAAVYLGRQWSDWVQQPRMEEAMRAAETRTPWS